MTLAERDKKGTLDWGTLVALALRHMGSSLELDDNPLTQLHYVKRLQEERYRQRFCAAGAALRDTLALCIKDVIVECENELRLADARTYLTLWVNGKNNTEIAQHLGKSREHISREVRTTAVQLVVAKLRVLNQQSLGRKRKH